MDLMTLLQRVEADFFGRLNKKTGWGKEEVKKEFNEAIKNVLILTYSSVMRDAGEAIVKGFEDIQKEKKNAS